MPLSLSPDRTISSLLWLLPCLAAMLGVARLGAFSPKSIAVAVVAVALLSVVIATLQVRSSASRWYFYEISNFGAGTGFFSNANHEGLLLVCGIPFVGALHRTVKGRRRSRSATSGYAAILGGALLILLAGLVLTRSRAAIGLAPAVLVATWLMVRDRSRRLPRWLVPLAALLLIGGAVVALSTPIASRVVAEETKHPEESRVSSFRNSGAAALDFAPVGSGIGTFQLVYGRYEDPLTVTRWYMNHVHNDYLELLLETGLPGLAAILLGLAWWGRRVAACWRDEQRDYAALAATIASAAILAHSLVDYPLRTAAISAIFTICCALLAVPGRRRSGRSLPEGERARHMSV
jgi:O-antigen ligase